PCIPSDWKKFEVKKKWRGRVYNIKVKNPDSVEKAVKSISLNGNLIEKCIPIQKAGSENEVDVIMGKG
ncbi:MAG: hypothetical protein ACM34M_05510, partial [Ignavibacteria bacterium]